MFGNSHRRTRRRARCLAACEVLRRLAGFDAPATQEGTVDHA